MSTNKPATQPRKKGNRLQHYFTELHVGLYRRTGGAIGGRMGGRNLLILTTIGRKSGQERHTPLLYIQDGEQYVLVASNGGAPSDPQWFRNIEAHPEARIQVGKQIIVVTAHKANPEERSRIWPIITGHFQNFADYQARTTREIPVVLLTPVAAS
ncbi:nitroreductase family deazaflavin-dependent oxidoreductase [Dictyobacter arantiisoli]|uniref:Nitroreductase n=1 Tax=Dictyobacter arantiisoli TaxID=2014874 RepID=A0A5A5TAN2_9CHLR|nr:nitroreductase family deazaflavin-dependent oxidoreductase [Dictyobacter arantiisoli]GCF08458.1 hypothetical protein KDI_20220 [Dictyobacter arantiisoli]